MSFSTFLKKLFSSKSSKKSNPKIGETEQMKKAIKETRHKYLNKTPSEISKMSVRDITMALQQLDIYCLKKIQKTNTATDIDKRNLNLLKQAKVSEQSYVYIYELIKILENKDKNRKREDLIEVKKSAKTYNPYIDNFQTAFDTVNKAAPGSLTKSPNAAWQKLMELIPAPENTSTQKSKV